MGPTAQFVVTVFGGAGFAEVVRAVGIAGDAFGDAQGRPSPS